jgi:hypothetical protein
MPSGTVDAVVSSPPYAASLNQVTNDDAKYAKSSEGVDRKYYGATVGNLGNMPDEYAGRNRGSGRETEAGNTFWAAASDIVSECWHILKPNGLAVFICKDFIRKGKRVPFSDDWRRLCESHGFELVEWIHASLVKEDRHPGLFGEDVVKRTERKSFFRRLAEKKGSPAIDHEDVLVVRKVATGAKSDGVADAVVSSPP